MRNVPAVDDRSSARSGEVCTNCDNHNAPFVTKVHKANAVGSVLWVRDGTDVRSGA